MAYLTVAVFQGINILYDCYMNQAWIIVTVNPGSSQLDVQLMFTL